MTPDTQALDIWLEQTTVPHLAEMAQVASLGLRIVILLSFVLAPTRHLHAKKDQCSTPTNILNRHLTCWESPTRHDGTESERRFD